MLNNAYNRDYKSKTAKKGTVKERLQEEPE
jgi:hypothetical protein